MGFFKNLFKRKKGGTFFGNLLRKASNKASGGILGNGADLKAWEKKEAQKEAAKSIAPLMSRTQSKSKTVAEVVKKLAEPDKEGFMDKAKVWLKKYWYVPVSVVVIVGGIIWYVKRKPTNRKRR